MTTSNKDDQQRSNEPQLDESEAGLNRAFRYLAKGLGRYLSTETGNAWWSEKNRDLSPVLREMNRHWHKLTLTETDRDWVKALLDFRNLAYHQGIIDDQEVLQRLYVIYKLLIAVSATEEAKKVADQCQSVGRKIFAQPEPRPHLGVAELRELRDQISEMRADLASISAHVESQQSIDTPLSHFSTAEVDDLSRPRAEVDSAVPINWNIRQPGYFVNRGRSFLIERRYDEAIECFHWAIHLNPDLGDEVKVPLAAAYGERGNSYYSVGEFQLALADYETALELNPTFAGAFLNRGNAWAALGELDRAISDYRKALEMDPGLALAHAALGIAYMNSGIPDQAIGAFDRALEFDQRSASFYLGRGNVYLDMEKFDLAIDDYNTALDIDPGYPIAYLNRGVAYRADGEYDLAIADWDKLIEILPESGPAYLNRGGTYALKGNFDSAISDFDMVLALYRDNPLAHCGKGNCLLLGKGEFQLAIEEYEKVIAVSGDDELVAYARRSIELAVRLREEVAEYDKFIDGDQDNPEGWHLRGLFYLDLGILPRADDDLSEAIRRREDYAEAYFDRARLRMRLVGIGAAISDFTEAILHKPEYSKAYLHRAICYWEVGEEAKAQSDSNKARELGFKP